MEKLLEKALRWIICLQILKKVLENANKKIIQPVQASRNQVSNENSILDIPEEINTTTEKGLPHTVNLSDNGNTRENIINTTLSRNNSVLSPSNLKRILATEKRAVKKLKSGNANETIDEIFKNRNV